MMAVVKRGCTISICESDHCLSTFRFPVLLCKLKICYRSMHPIREKGGNVSFWRTLRRVGDEGNISLWWK